MITKIVKTTRKTWGGSHFYIQNESRLRVSHRDIAKLICDGDVEFLKCLESEELLSILKTLETDARKDGFINRFIQGDTEMLSRVIFAGGFTSYISILEEKIK